MIIMNYVRTCIHDTDAYGRIFLQPKNDGCLICLGAGYDAPPVKIGAYDDEKQAQEILEDIFTAIIGGAKYYEMPPREIEKLKKDARTARKGSS